MERLGQTRGLQRPKRGSSAGQILTEKELAGAKKCWPQSYLILHPEVSSADGEYLAQWHNSASIQTRLLLQAMFPYSCDVPAAAPVRPLSSSKLPAKACPSPKPISTESVPGTSTVSLG